MRHLSVLTVLCASMSVSSLALAEEPELSQDAQDALTAFELSGESRSCLSTRRIRDIEPIGESEWLVELTNGSYYLNRVGRGCRNAGEPFSYMQYTTYGGNLCRGEIVRIIDNSGHFTRGSCSLGDFEQLIELEDESAVEAK